MFKLHVVCSCTLVVAMTLFSFAPQAYSKPVVTNMTKEQTLANYKSYKEWKSQMVDQAQARLDRIKATLEQQRTTAGSKVDPNLKNQLAREQLQVTISGELSITDYFVGYLNKQTDVAEAIKNTSGKLSAEDVAELMTAFAYNFNKQEALPSQLGSNATQNHQSD